eukprot:sb/3472700/
MTTPLSSLSLRYRLTNGHHFDDVHLQLIIEIKPKNKTTIGKLEYRSRLSLRYRLTNDFDDVHLQLIIIGKTVNKKQTSAPIGLGCAASKVFFITHPTSPGGSFRIATELVTMKADMSRLSLRYRITNDFDDVHLQLIIIGAVCRLDTAERTATTSTTSIFNL